jgi:hypothetical protein
MIDALPTLGITRIAPITLTRQEDVLAVLDRGLAIRFQPSAFTS